MDHVVALAAAGVRKLRPYEPGKPIEALERELGLTDVIKLASNENPLGPGERAKAALSTACNDLERYPDGSGHRLKAAIAEVERVSPDEITLGNGSNDILELVARVFLGRDRRALFSQYAFAVYPLATLGMDATPEEAEAWPAGAGMPFGHDPATLVQGLGRKPNVAFIANPNNPTGTWLTPDELEAVLDAAPSSTIVVLDEAYREYMDPALRPNTRILLNRYPNLIVTRTFSKVHGLAALRVGYSLSSPAIADLLNRVRQPFNNNSIALTVAEAALGDHEHVERSVQHNQTEMAELSGALAELDCRTLPSQANFLTFHVGHAADAVQQRLLEHGVIVRPLGGYGMPEYLRVTVGTESENIRFIKALKESLL